jgi:hypothetical protein
MTTRASRERQETLNRLASGWWLRTPGAIRYERPSRSSNPSSRGNRVTEDQDLAILRINQSTRLREQRHGDGAVSRCA